MDAKMNTLKENEVFRLVARLKGKKVVKSKWVFCVKKKSDGSVEKYKGRVVAEGFCQV